MLGTFRGTVPQCRMVLGEPDPPPRAVARPGPGKSWASRNMLSKEKKGKGKQLQDVTSG